MTTQRVTLALPESLMRRAQQTAQTLDRPLEEVLTDVLAAALPNVDDAPADLQAELAGMTWLDSDALWQIARSEMSPQQQQRLATLSDRQPQHPLTQDEAALLAQLRNEYGRVTLRKARAYALLSLRGGRPLLSEN
jgi:hypothetical protein